MARITTCTCHRIPSPPQTLDQAFPQNIKICPFLRALFAIALVGGQMVKQRVAFIPRGATVAWGPTTDCAGMIASGTVGGAFDGSFDATASLEIFQMDLSSKTGQMEMLGSVQTPERFHRLAWGSFGANCSSLPLGMLAGGMVDGTVKVFDPAVLAR